jgi:hypothetical protein
MNVTEGNSNTIHLAYVDSLGVAGTQCNRELFITINRRRRIRIFYRDDRPVTCKKCQKDLDKF